MCVCARVCGVLTVCVRGARVCGVWWRCVRVCVGHVGRAGVRVSAWRVVCACGMVCVCSRCGGGMGAVVCVRAVCVWCVVCVCVRVLWCVVCVLRADVYVGIRVLQWGCSSDGRALA